MYEFNQTLKGFGAWRSLSGLIAKLNCRSQGCR
jgi:methylthioribulose-1-phosphate dehydratase